MSVESLSGFLCGFERLSRSTLNIKAAGRILGLPKLAVESVIAPQDLHVYRLHPVINGKPVCVWGCTSFHNRARGIYKGGIRIDGDVGIGETIELSRLMTLKTALVELELGGAKTGIQFDMRKAYEIAGVKGYDPLFEKSVRRAIIQEYAHHYRGMLEKRRYVPAPDMGTGPDEMVVIYDETKQPSSVTGKPDGVPGWLPGRAEATGYGVSFLALKAMEEKGMDPARTKVAVHGYGNVGSHSAIFLAKAGAKIVAVADKNGAVENESGLDVGALAEHAKATGSVAGFEGGKPAADFWATKVDVMIPAAANDAITKDVAARIKAKIIVEGANFPTTHDGFEVLVEKGALLIPDILANAGGVLASSIEYHCPSSTRKVRKEDVFAAIEDALGRNYEAAAAEAAERKITLDLACGLLAVDRVYRSMRNHGWL